MTRDEFINQIAQYVKKYASSYGIMVHSPIIAQACKESAFGTSELGVNAHNYFGIKYKNGRTPIAIGGYSKETKEEYTIGQISTITACFAKFKSMEDCVIGYFQFLSSASRYDCLKGVTDAEEYCHLIKASGYATGSNYDNSLINDYIKKYDLTRFDKREEVKTMGIKVGIDAGHGSNTAGKRTPDGYREHWTNVKTAYYCEQLLKANGIETVRIGWNDLDSTDDADISLTERQKQIKNAKCDYSISCHVNAFGDGKSFNSAEGVDTFYHADSSKRGDSVDLAKAVQNRLIEGTSQKNRGVKAQNLAMCNCSAMRTKASILCEIAFMTNKREAELIKTDAFCKEQGEQIALGFMDYKGIVAKKESAEVNKESNNKTPFIVLLKDNLNIRKTPNGTIVKVDGCKKGIKYTIVEVSGNWGKLKSGAGWISINPKYVDRV